MSVHPQMVRHQQFRVLIGNCSLLCEIMPDEGCVVTVYSSKCLFSDDDNVTCDRVAQTLELNFPSSFLILSLG